MLGDVIQELELRARWGALDHHGGAGGPQSDMINTKCGSVLREAMGADGATDSGLFEKTRLI